MFQAPFVFLSIATIPRVPLHRPMIKAV